MQNSSTAYSAVLLYDRFRLSVTFNPHHLCRRFTFIYVHSTYICFNVFRRLQSHMGEEGGLFSVGPSH